MPESLVMAYIERELMSPPPLVSSRAKSKEFKEAGKCTIYSSSLYTLIRMTSQEDSSCTRNAAHRLMETDTQSRFMTVGQTIRFSFLWFP